jgi:hypothetical protein
VGAQGERGVGKTRERKRRAGKENGLGKRGFGNVLEKIGDSQLSGFLNNRKLIETFGWDFSLFSSRIGL